MLYPALVILPGINTDEIATMARLAQRHRVEVRFIEQMPFNGSSTVSANAMTAKQAKIIIQKNFHTLESHGSSGTAKLYQIPQFKGKIGFISGYTRQFCQTCNKVRITAAGMLKTCLYDNGRLDLKTLLRIGARDSEIRDAILKAVFDRAPDGFSAEAESLDYEKNSMAAIGG